MNDSLTVPLAESVVQVSSLDKAAYEIVRNSILKNLWAYGPLTHEELASLAQDHLKLKLSQLAAWHIIVVEQELEARGEIRLVSGSNPPLLEINL